MMKTRFNNAMRIAAGLTFQPMTSSSPHMSSTHGITIVSGLMRYPGSIW